MLLSTLSSCARLALFALVLFLLGLGPRLCRCFLLLSNNLKLGLIREDGDLGQCR